MSLHDASRNLEMADAQLVSLQSLLARMGIRVEIINSLDQTIGSVRKANVQIAKHECHDHPAKHTAR